MIDVLVIGAGPAGATAARALAIGGARVRLLDRAAFPRNKPCGGLISGRALSRFPWLVDALTRIPTHWISKLHLQAPSGGVAQLQSATPAGFTIRRVEFDHLLVQLAVEAGVELIEGVEIAQAVESSDRVDVRARDGRTFHAPQVIAADGIYSVVARRLGINPAWPATSVALDMMEEAPADTLAAVDPATLWVSYGHDRSEGYAYVFPKKEHVNVGIGYVLDHYRRRVDRPPYELQAALVDRLRAAGVLRGTSSRRHFTPFQIPVGGPLTRTATRRVIVAGDAGGFVNGITAEGIYYAMVSGELAAVALRGEGPAAYQDLWRREVGAELRDSVLVQRDLLTHPARVDAVVAGASRNPDLAGLLVRYAMGEVSYRTARRRLLLASPAAAVRLAFRGLAARFYTPNLPSRASRSIEGMTRVTR